MYSANGPHEVVNEHTSLSWNNTEPSYPPELTRCRMTASILLTSCTLPRVMQTRGYFLSHVRTAYAHDNGSVVLDVSERKVSSVPVRVRYYKVQQPAEDKKAAKGKWRERGACGTGGKEGSLPHARYGWGVWVLDCCPERRQTRGTGPLPRSGIEGEVPSE